MIEILLAEKAREEKKNEVFFGCIYLSIISKATVYKANMAKCNLHVIVVSEGSSKD